MPCSGHGAASVVGPRIPRGGKAAILRVVLDTNVVFSGLKYPSGTIGELRKLWQASRFIPVASKPMLEELMRVLAYPKFTLGEPEQQNLLADYLPYVQVAGLSATRNSPLAKLPPLPVCRDEKDQMFLQAAQRASVDFLVTGDQDLLVLSTPASRTRLGFEICSPAQLLANLIH